MRIKITYTLLILFALSSFSCDDYLDLRPQDGTVRQDFWKTKEDIQAAVIGIYSSMLNNPPSVNDRSLPEYLFMYGELRADMVAPGPNVIDEQTDFMTSNILPSNSITSWAAFYRVINYCNTVIDLAPAVIDEDPTLTQDQLNNYLAEALTIRAYMYFTLARTFKEVPLKIEATLTDKDNFQLPVTPQEQIFEQVKLDLEKAETLAKEDYGNIPENKGRITKHAINAIQTDVYLWTNEFQNALDAANKIVNSGKYNLIPATNNWFNTVYAQGNSSESIFEFQYTPQNLNPFYSIFLQRPQFLAAPSVLEDVFGVDYDDPENKDIRGERASMVPGTNEIYKYTGLNENERKALQNSDTHWFVYRYAGILLLKAEALNELGRSSEALEIITEIRETREAIQVTSENVNPDNKNAVTDYILAERAREMAFEGKRWFDILRNARRNNYERLDILIAVAINSAPPSQQQSIVNKLQDPNSHYLPINEYELYTNKELNQNPFYN